MAINDDFEKWACSFSGCDGGDLGNSEIWVSGIEWGYGKPRGVAPEDHEQKLRNYYNQELPAEFAAASVTYAKTYEIGKNTEYQFGLTLAKLYSAIQGRHASEYQEIASETDGTEVFKLNLYPIAFPETADSYWQQYDLNSITGLETKSLYRVWCSMYRFPYFVEQVRTYKPRLIIGAGISYLQEFILAFAGERGANDLGRIQIKPKSEKNGKARDLYWARVGEHTILVVTPFFGRQQNLNSDYLIDEFGREIRSLL